MLSYFSRKPRGKIFLSTISIVILLGFWLRWRFVQTVHLYPDEFVTLLAIKMIGQSGLPVMPSGLFYEHGLLFSYLGSLATLIGGSFLAVRFISLTFGILTIFVCFRIGRHWFSPAVGLMAMAGLAIAPVAIHWSGRVRMYALLQLMILVVLWLAYEGLVHNKPNLRWAALLTYFGATLTHFVSVTLAPPLILFSILVWRSGKAEERHSYRGNRSIDSQSSQSRLFLGQRILWPELVTLGAILLIAFLVKRSGQPKGIEALEANAGSAIAGLIQVFNIYSDFSFNLIEGWQAIAPFYLNLPALIFTPFAIIAMVEALSSLGHRLSQSRPENGDQDSQSETSSSGLAVSISTPLFTPTFFLGLMLALTTLEMVLLVSPERRDDKYLFMLLPVLLLLGSRGMAILGNWLLNSGYTPLGASHRLGFMDSQSLLFKAAIPNDQTPRLLISHFTPVTICILVIIFTWPDIQTLLANRGDDYDSAFTYVQEHWQEGDTVMTGTPAAAAFYLGRSDFYSVQRRGGYDYRLLTVDEQHQPVDRWLASPVIRTEADLHRTLTNNKVWLVLERWGLQREYYDPSFQQQLLAQTDYVAESQGIFILHSRANPEPIALEPAHYIMMNEAVAAPIFGDMVQLIGYTVEPEKISLGQSLRLTLYWQATAPMPADYTVFVHLRDPENGTTLAQADHRPLANLYPTSIWPVGEMIRESSGLTLPADISPGDYDLWAGLYLLETGERLPLKNDASGQNAVQLGSLAIGE